MNDDIQALLDRIAAGMYTAADLAPLRRALIVSGQGSVVQVGKYNLQIGEGQDIRIEDTIYQGPTAEAIQAAIRAALRAGPLGPSEDELRQAEARYLEHVVATYNRLGFSGFPEADRMLPEVPLDKVFVRLSLTVEKMVRVRDGDERAESGERPETARWGKDAKERRERERIVRVQEPVTLAAALSKNVLIVGEPGAGKSTLLRWLAVTYARGWQREVARLGPEAEGDRLPVYVELGRLPDAYLRGEGGKTPNWKELLPELIAEQQAFEPTAGPAVARALADGQCLVLCDGLDEVADRTARARIAGSLAEFGRLSAGNRVAIGSRPAGIADAESALRPGFQRCQIERFTPDDVQRFFRFWYGLDANLTPDQQAAEADALHSRVQANPGIAKLAATPLLATILLLIWRNEGDLPGRRVEVYERCCKILVENWERHHEVGHGGVLGTLGWEAHLGLLAPVAYAIHGREQRTNATRDELAPVLTKSLLQEGLCSGEQAARREADSFLAGLGLRSGLLQRLGPEEYGFPHLTFQEYLVARYIAEQPYPDYIDLFMTHLHEAWWREVQVLAIEHLWTRKNERPKAQKLVLSVLSIHPVPLLLLRPFSMWSLAAALAPPEWISGRVDRIRLLRIASEIILSLAFIIAVMVLVIPRWVIAGSLPRWQLARRLAWVLQREFELVATALGDYVPSDGKLMIRREMSRWAAGVLRQIARDPGRYEAGGTLIPTACGQLMPRDQGVLIDDLLKTARAYPMRPAVIEILGHLNAPGEKAIDFLVGQVNEADHSYQGRQSGRSAIESLERLQAFTPAPVNAMLNILAKPDLLSFEEMPAAAARFLGQLNAPTPEVFEALAKALEGPLSAVHAAVTMSLGDLAKRHPQAVTIMVHHLARYLRLMFRIPSPLMPTLVALAVENEMVRSELKQVMEHGGEGASQAATLVLARSRRMDNIVEAKLVVVLGGNDWIWRADALQSINESTPPSEGMVSALVKLLLEPGNWLISPQKWRATDLLVHWGKVHECTITTKILEALEGDNARQRLGATESAGMLAIYDGRLRATLRDSLIKRMREDEESVRAVAATSLGTLTRAWQAEIASHRQAFERLLQRIRDAHSPSEIDQALGAIGLSEGWGRLSSLAAIAPDERADAVRQIQAAVESGFHELEAMQIEPIWAILAEALTDTSQRVRVMAAAALTQAGHIDEAARSILLQAVGSLDEEAVLASIAALRTCPNTRHEASTAIAGLLDVESPLVFDAARSALGELGDADESLVTILVRKLPRTRDSLARLCEREGSHGLKLLLRHLDSDDPHQRCAVVHVLGELQHVTSELLLALVQALEDDEGSVQEAAVDSLCALAGRDASIAWLLAEVAQRHRNGEIRARAVRKLGSTDDTGVVEALAEALSDSEQSVRRAALAALGNQAVEPAKLGRLLIALNSVLHGGDDEDRCLALASIRRLVDGRCIPGHNWIPIREETRQWRQDMDAHNEGN